MGWNIEPRGLADPLDDLHARDYVRRQLTAVADAVDRSVDVRSYFW